MGYDTDMFENTRKSDKQIFSLAKKETERQKYTVDLIASENIAPLGVLELLGSPLTNKYSEGYPGKRYYPGNKFCDEMELLAQKRARELFGLRENQWHVNVQSYSGAVANLAIYLSVLKPGGTILSMNLSSGGHLSHGSKASFTGKLFNIVHYGVDKNYRIDYKEIEFLVKKIKPAMIISGASAYPFAINFKKIGTIARKTGAYHIADISHYAGLVSAKLYPSPFGNADFVMATTHKSLFGPRAAIIFADRNSITSKKQEIDIAHAIDKAVFPGIQGGPHNNAIAAVACGLFLARSSKAKKYYAQVVKNAKSLAANMAALGFEIVGGGTESHMFLVRTSPLGVDGYEAETMLEKAGILANRNTISGDSSPLRPSAIRIGTYAVTARGMKEREMEKIAKLIFGILINKEKPDLVKKFAIRLCKKFRLSDKNED